MRDEFGIRIWIESYLRKILGSDIDLEVFCEVLTRIKTRQNSPKNGDFWKPSDQYYQSYEAG